MTSSAVSAQQPSDLDVDSQLQTAREATGLDDYADPDIASYLGRYLEAVIEADLSSGGIAGQVATIHRFLVNRLRAQADITEHPEILDELVAEPVVIIGMPRTGTTKLQRMMSQDPAVQSLALWKVLNPAPLPGTDSTKPDPRIAFAEQVTRATEQAFPEFAAGHPQGALEADEDAYLLLMGFRSVGCGLMVHAPEYLVWAQQLPQPTVEQAYGYHKLLLQYLQWQDGGGRGRPWILKSPIHTGQLEALLAVFPDATVVHCHRDMATAVGSYCWLLETTWRMTGHGEIDPAEIGRTMVDLWSAELRRYVWQRERLSERLRVVDVSYGSLIDDPVGVIQKIYAACGRELDDAAASLMRDWAAESDRDRKKGTSYSYALERYGLTDADVADAFAPYNALVSRIIDLD